jgi:hypothetical protein
MNNRYYSREFDVQIQMEEYLNPTRGRCSKFSSIVAPFVLTGLSVIMCVEAFNPGYFPYDYRIVTGFFCLSSFVNAIIIFRKFKKN